ncbi:MAG: sugar kinase [Candidatus Omnitrophica bacterium]|nr:sugar kinase [Candidatus Omnitrophota bacterium]
MALTIIGSVAYDNVETKFGKKKDLLGGSATFASVAASFFTKVNLISVVGTDFSKKHIDLFHKHKINTDGLEVKDGKTFRWDGKYHDDLCHRDTLDVQLNVFNDFKPAIPTVVKKQDDLFLANIDPDLQSHIFKSVKPEGLVSCDTMDLWINIKKKPLLALMKKLDILFLNDEEARMLSGEFNLLDAAKYIQSKGVKIVVIKKGEHGALMFHEGLEFIVPPFLVSDVKDPTGAGDTFAGGTLGYLASKKKITNSVLREALVYGSILASFTVEKFSIDGLLGASKKTVGDRVKVVCGQVEF